MNTVIYLDNLLQDSSMNFFIAIYVKMFYFKEQRVCM